LTIGTFAPSMNPIRKAALKAAKVSFVLFTEIRMRLKDKIAIVVGAGQSPGEGLGNGRATVLRFAQEGAKVLAVDDNRSSAEETVAIARQAGGECVAFEADVAVEATLVAMVEAARQRWGRVDVLHYNVGVSIAGGDAPLDEITELHSTESLPSTCAAPS
jgi:NAD(P)-dependent dehydrogenase (short-subunit alcohol dehydrogenase family)